MIKLLVVIGFLSANFYVYNFLAREAVIPDRETFASFPDYLSTWRCGERAEIDGKTLENLGATDYLLCSFTNSVGPLPINLYMGYHATQVREEGGGSGENAIHPPAHCLPGSGWDIVKTDTLSPPLPGFTSDSPQIKRLIVAKGESRQLVYYWYQSRGRVIAEDWKKIVFVGWDRATRNRTDGALIRFTVPVPRGKLEEAESAFQEFASLVIPELPRFVPN